MKGYNNMSYLKKGIMESNTEHEFGSAGFKVMTLYTKIKIELLLKNQDIQSMLKDIHFSNSTFNKLKYERPNERMYFSLAEYFGLDVNELKKLPIRRDEVIETVDGEELYIKDINTELSAYSELDEVYYSDWFHGSKREEFINKCEEEEIERQLRIEELNKQKLELITKTEEKTPENILVFNIRKKINDTNSTAEDVGHHIEEQHFDNGHEQHYHHY